MRGPARPSGARMGPPPGPARRLVLFLAKLSFYLYALLWLIRPWRAESLSEVYELFYIGFLRLRREDVEVVRLSGRELVTRSRNPCPVLKLALLLKLDTRYVCRYVSEPVSRYVVERLNPRLAFERNYGHIRPYSDSCEERIYWRGG
ncbi:MAG: hypothetical protein QXT74_06015 [Candidatus Nezhaarchaeales archaeon]